MFKRLQKSVIDKKKLLNEMNSKRVNKTPSKNIFPNRANLTFANIIVNMSSSNSLSREDSWYTSYFNTEIKNNPFSYNPKNKFKELNDNSKNLDNKTKLLSAINEGIQALKAKDALTYCMNLVKIMACMRDNSDLSNFMNIKNKMSKELLSSIYNTYFQNFPENSLIYNILQNDLKNGRIIFKKVHLMYILYLLSGISSTDINSYTKITNSKFHSFLNHFINSEKCKDSKCPLCSQIDSTFLSNFMKNKNNTFQKYSVIKIFRKDNKNKYINNIPSYCSKMYNLKQKVKNNLINNSNDNIKSKYILNSSQNNNYIDKSFNKLTEKNKKIIFPKINEDINNNKILCIQKRKATRNNNANKKKTFFSQIIKDSRRKKESLFNDSLQLKDQTKYTYYNQKDDISYENNTFNDIYYTEKNDKFTNCNAEDIKDNVNQNYSTINNPNNSSKQCKRAKLNLKKANTNNNKKIIDIKKKLNDFWKKEKNKEGKNIKIKIGEENNTNMIGSIGLYNSERKADENNNNLRLGFILKSSTMAIEEDINSIENEIQDFKEKNNNIRQQLYLLTQKNK